MDTPAEGSVWRHHSGRQYTVLFVANEPDGDQDKYPLTVVYQGENGKRWAGRLDDWHRRMTQIDKPTFVVGDQVKCAEYSGVGRVTVVSETFLEVLYPYGKITARVENFYKYKSKVLSPEERQRADLRMEIAKLHGENIRLRTSLASLRNAACVALLSAVADDEDFWYRELRKLITTIHQPSKEGKMILKYTLAVAPEIQVEAFQVPARGEVPDEDIIDLVHEKEWPADDDGINLGDGAIAFPGDWIVMRSGRASIVRDGIFQVTFNLVP